jgi:hypothetical protein
LPPESPISLQAQWIGITSSVREKVITFANRCLLVKGADPKFHDKHYLHWAYKRIVVETTPADVTGSSDVSDHLAFLDQFEAMVGDVSIPAWGAAMSEYLEFFKLTKGKAKILAIEDTIPDRDIPIPGHTLLTYKDLRRLVASPDGTEVELLTRLQDFLCINTTSERRVHVLKGTTTGMDTSRSMREVSITLPFQCDACQGIFNIAPVDPQSPSQSQSNNPNYTHQVCIFLILSIYLCC